jgi:hypothetical protein
MDLIVMVAIAAAMTALLIAREVRRNRRARAVLIGDGFDVDLQPPWFVAKQHREADGPSGERPQGVWAAWYREGKLGAYVCTHVTVSKEHGGDPLPITSARLEIVDDPDDDRSILAVRDVPVPSHNEAPSKSLDIDESISIDSEEPGRKTALMLVLRVGSSWVERRLCPIEHRFAAAGAKVRERTER